LIAPDALVAMKASLECMARPQQHWSLWCATLDQRLDQTGSMIRRRSERTLPHHLEEPQDFDVLRSDEVASQVLDHPERDSASPTHSEQQFAT
jgi:hypothetical protein